MGRCRSCEAPVTWASHHESGNSMPLEEATEEQIEKDENLWRISRDHAGQKVAYPANRSDAMGLFPVKLYISHFATCPDADAWRSDA